MDHDAVGGAGRLDWLLVDLARRVKHLSTAGERIRADTRAGALSGRG